MPHVIKQGGTKQTKHDTMSALHGEIKEAGDVALSSHSNATAEEWDIDYVPYSNDQIKGAVFDIFINMPYKAMLHLPYSIFITE